MPLSTIWSDTLVVFANSGYSLFKIEAHVVCATVLIILFCRQQNSSDQTEARLAWSKLLFVQILYCISGIIRVLVDVGIIPRTYISQWLVTAVTFWLFGAMCWLVFEYIELYQNSNLMASRSKRINISIFSGNVRRFFRARNDLRDSLPVDDVAEFRIPCSRCCSVSETEKQNDSL